MAIKMILINKLFKNVSKHTRLFPLRPWFEADSSRSELNVWFLLFSIFKSPNMPLP